MAIDKDKPLCQRWVFITIVILSIGNICASTIGVTTGNGVTDEAQSRFTTEGPATSSPTAEASSPQMKTEADPTSDGSFPWQNLLIIVLEPSIIISQCNRLSTTNIAIDISCPGFPDADKVNVTYFFEGKRLGKTTYCASDTRHELYYDAKNGWQGCIVAKAKDDYGYTAEAQFLIPEVPNLHWWQQKLQETYQRRKRKLQYLNPSKANEDDLFKELSFENKRGETIVSYKDLFNLKTSDNRLCKHILLSGRSGSGKTIFMNQLTCLWSSAINRQKLSPASEDSSSGKSDQQVLTRFKLVFLLNLRDLKAGSDVCQMIEDQLIIDMPAGMKDQLLDTVSRLGMECLFLLDGYDEISPVVNDEQFLNSPLLSHSTVIVSTEPYKAHEFCNKLGQDVESIQVLGFGFSSRLSYVETYLSKFNEPEETDDVSPNAAKDFIGRLSSSEELDALSRIPMFLSLMCICWESSKSLQGSIVSLYQNVVDIVCSNCKETGIIKESVDSAVTLKGLGSAALEGLFAGEISFGEKYMDVTTDLVETGRSLGLVFRDLTGTSMDETRIRFVHKTWQEFCAAMYWVGLKRKQFKEYLDRIDGSNVGRMEGLLRFSCGLSYESAQMIVAHVAALSEASTSKDLAQNSDHGDANGANIMGIGLGSDQDPWRLPLLLLSDIKTSFKSESLSVVYNSLQSLFETLRINIDTPDQEFFAILNKENLKWPKFVRKVSVLWKQPPADTSPFVNVTIKLFKAMPRVNTMAILVHPSYVKSVCTDLIMSMTGAVKSVEHFSCQVDFDPVRMAQFLDQQNLKTLKLLSHPDVKLDCTYLLKSMTRVQSIQDLECSVSGDLRTMALFVNRQNNIKKLTINPNEGMDGARFLKTMSDDSKKVTKTLEEIEMSRLDFGSEDSISDFVAQNSSLRRLVLHECKAVPLTFKHAAPKSQCQSLHAVIIDRCSKRVVENLIPVIGFSTLKELRVESVNDLREPDCAKLFKLIKEAGKQKKSLALQVLGLRGTHIGKAVLVLGEAFAFMKNLITLDVNDTALPYTDIRDFFEGLWQLSNLEHLDLGNNKIGSAMKRMPNSLANREVRGKPLSLKTLNLSACDLSEQNRQILATVLQCSPHLRHLDLSNNQSLGKTLEKIKVLNGGLRCPKLLKMNLDNTGIASASMSELCTNWLNGITFPQLSVLSLRNNGMGAVEFEKIASMFQNKLDIVGGMSYVVLDVGGEEGESTHAGTVGRLSPSSTS